MKSLLAALIAAGWFAFVSAGRAGDAPKSEGRGTLTLGTKTYKLASALAYEQTVFRKKEIAVILSEKPLNTAKLMQSLKKNGNDDDFFPTDVHVKLSFDGQGELLQLSVHAGGLNIIRSGDRNIKASAAVKDGSVKGTAGTKTDEEAGDKAFKFDVAFDVAVIQAARTNPEPTPPQEPKPKVKTKSAPGEPVRPQPGLEKEQRFEGTLTNDSPKVMGKPAEIHQVRLSPDKTYVIDLESNDFDAYLRILDSNGKQLASDDDGGEGFNARIRFTPPKDDTYQLVATRFASGQGDYLLKVRALESNPPRKTKAAPGEPGRLQPGEKELRYEGRLTSKSPKVMGKPAQVHQVTMSPGQTYVIDLESNDFDAYLRILDSNGKQLASDDDSGDGLNARIRFAPPKEDTYQIVATRFASGQGNYVLKIRVLRPGEER